MSDQAEDLLLDHVEISTPGILYRVVDNLKEFISKGLLVEVKGTCSLTEIQEGRPWPDDLIPCAVKPRHSCRGYKALVGRFLALDILFDDIKWGASTASCKIAG